MARHSARACRAALDPLFRPLLLDGISMLTLIGQADLARELKAVQIALMRFLREPKEMPLCEVLPLAQLQDAAMQYARLISQRAALLSVQDAPADR